MLKPGLVRFILASIVIFFHITGFIYIGTMAVYCFFILSGYWISFMYDAKYSKLSASVQKFYISRVLRILPVYYLFSAISVIMLYIYNPVFFARINQLSASDKWFFLGSNLLLLGYNQLATKIIVPAWSLDIELQFYVIFPLLILILNTRVNRLVAIVFFGCVALLIQLSTLGMIFQNSLLVYLFYFLIGIALHKDIIFFTKKTQIVFNTLFIVVLLSHYFFRSLHELVRDNTGSYQDYFNKVMALLLVPLLTQSVRIKSDKADRVLGDMSYVLYLSHWTWLTPYNYYIQDLTKVQRIPYAICYLVVTYILSYVLYKYFDLPIDQKRRQLLEPVGVRAAKP
jgi:peptidoglycan/LPS O-acetylase OafA/YrhL